MPEAIELLHLSHLNAIVDGYESAVEHFTTTLGMRLNMEIPDDGDVRACLMTLGGVIYELFAPNDRNAERGQGRLLGKFGDHYIGAEYEVPDVPVARDRCAALDVRILNDRDRFFFTYPGSTHGIAFELWNGDWHRMLAEENDNMRASNGRLSPVGSKEHWRDEHPLGLTGLVRCSSAVEDLDVATARFKEVFGADELYRVERPAAAATAAGLRLGDTVLELMAPTGPGAVRGYLDRYGERIRSTVYGVVDLSKVEKHLADKGVPMVDGDAPGTRAIPPEHNHGLMFEFSEEPATHP